MHTRLSLSLLGIDNSLFQNVSRIASVYQQTRWYSGRRNFIQDWVNKMKEEYNRDKELKESITKFQQETQKLEKSEEIQKMRDYYKKIETEIGTDASQKAREALQQARQKFEAQINELKKQDAVMKGLHNVGKAAQTVGDAVSKTATQLGQTNVMKYAKEGVKLVEHELESDRAKIYRPPAVLQTRAELAGKRVDTKVYQPDENVSEVVLHKDSKLFAAWQDFKDNNRFVQKAFDLKRKYDESDSALLRTTRFLTERVTSVFGSMVTTSELQETLTQIHKMDPNFAVEDFLRFVRFEIIPNVLEAIARGELEVLKDWCYEAPFNVISQPFKQARQMGLRHDCRILDIQNVELATGKMMEQGPVLVINFIAQQIQTVRDRDNKVVEGNPEEIVRVVHVWALCRDQTELNPWAAWRVLDLAMMPSKQWL